MPDFSPACQASRDAYQTAYKNYLAARTAHFRSKGDLSRANDALTAAQAALTAAQNASIAADRAWDTYTNSLKLDPSLGIPNVESGVLPPTAAPFGAAVAGLFMARTPPNFNLWAAGSGAAQSAWLQAADPAMQRTNALKLASGNAGDVLIARTADHTAAAANKTAAEVAEAAAGAARTAASEATSAARAAIGAACGNEKGRHPLGGGGEVSVDPGVLPADEKEVRDRLATLPDTEKQGLDKVELGDDVRKDAAGKPELIAGEYYIGARSIHLYTLGHSERTLKHEVGHHVYFHRLKPAARARWDQYFSQGNNGKFAPDGPMPTSYAATDAAEGFAECYEYLRDNRHLDPALRRLLEEILGELR